MSETFQQLIRRTRNTWFAIRAMSHGPDAGIISNVQNVAKVNYHLANPRPRRMVSDD